MATLLVQPSLLNALPHLAPVIFLPLLVAAATYGGWWIAAPLLFFALLEPVDKLSGSEERSMNPNGMPKNRLMPYKFVLWVWVACWPATLFYVLWNILAAGHLAAWEALLIAVALGETATIVLVASHELLHEGSSSRRWIAEFLLCSVGCAPYAIDHIYVHHAHVATPRDPASARKGESFWRYLPKSLSGNLARAWESARMRLSRRGLTVWHFSNPFWRLAAGTAAWYILAWWMAGVWGLLIFLVVNAIALLSLRLGDYIEHYGLQRIYLPSGRFEPPGLHHSWNASGRLSNWVYYNTQRHSDHHIKPGRLWPLLQNHAPDSAPRFPETYSAMFGLAMFPRRWFETMDPMVERWRTRFYPEIKDWSVYESAAFAARPEAFEAIAEILESSPRLRGWIERDPRLLDNLQRKEFTDIELPKNLELDPEADTIARKGLVRLYWTHEFGVEEMKEQIAETAVPDIAAMVESVREWTNSKTFQVCVHEMRGNLTAEEAAKAFSNVAEASISSVLLAVEESLSGRYIEGGGGLALILGDAAKGRMTLGSELEISFIHDGGDAENGESFCRLFRRELSVFLQGNLLFAPVSRPGNKWPLHSLDNLRELQQQASLDELGDIASARPVYGWGDSGILDRFNTVRCTNPGSGSTQSEPRPLAQSG